MSCKLAKFCILINFLYTSWLYRSLHTSCSTSWEKWSNISINEIIPSVVCIIYSGHRSLTSQWKSRWLGRNMIDIDMLSEAVQSRINCDELRIFGVGQVGGINWSLGSIRPECRGRLVSLHSPKQEVRVKILPHHHHFLLPLVCAYTLHTCHQCTTIVVTKHEIAINN